MSRILEFNFINDEYLRVFLSTRTPTGAFLQVKQRTIDNPTGFFRRPRLHRLREFARMTLSVILFRSKRLIEMERA